MKIIKYDVRKVKPEETVYIMEELAMMSQYCLCPSPSLVTQLSCAVHVQQISMCTVDQRLPLN